MFKDQFWFRALIKGHGVRMLRVSGMGCGLPNFHVSTGYIPKPPDVPTGTRWKPKYIVNPQR